MVQGSLLIMLTELIKLIKFIGFVVKIGKRLKVKGKRPGGDEAWRHSHLLTTIILSSAF